MFMAFVCCILCFFIKTVLSHFPTTESSCLVETHPALIIHCSPQVEVRIYLHWTFSYTHILSSSLHDLPECLYKVLYLQTSIICNFTFPFQNVRLKYCEWNVDTEWIPAPEEAWFIPSDSNLDSLFPFSGPTQ